MFDNDTENPPFFIPFLVATAFGIPVTVIWFLLAMKAGFVATIVTILLGCACGFGARVSASGLHPAGAAVLSTLLLITLCMSAITISLLASGSGQTFLGAMMQVLTQGNFGDFANAVALVFGRTFIWYPLGLYAAYRVSDAS